MVVCRRAANLDCVEIEGLPPPRAEERAVVEAVLEGAARRAARLAEVSGGVASLVLAGFQPDPTRGGARHCTLVLVGPVASRASRREFAREGDVSPAVEKGQGGLGGGHLAVEPVVGGGPCKLRDHSGGQGEKVNLGGVWVGQEKAECMLQPNRASVAIRAVEGPPTAFQTAAWSFRSKGARRREVPTVQTRCIRERKAASADQARRAHLVMGSTLLR